MASLNKVRVQLLDTSSGAVLQEVDVLTSADSVTFSDGQTFQQKLDSGALKGATGAQGIQGATGAPFAIAKTYASISAMNAGYSTDGLTQGSFVLIDTGNVNDTDNAKLYYKGATDYTYLTDLSGAQGMQGAQGIQGIQGATGATGSTGAQGIQGVAGADGANVKFGTDYTSGTTVKLYFKGLSFIGKRSSIIFFQHWIYYVFIFHIWQPYAVKNKILFYPLWILLLIVCTYMPVLFNLIITKRDFRTMLVNRLI